MNVGDVVRVRADGVYYGRLGRVWEVLGETVHVWINDGGMWEGVVALPRSGLRLNPPTYDFKRYKMTTTKPKPDGETYVAAVFGDDNLLYAVCEDLQSLGREVARLREKGVKYRIETGVKRPAEPECPCESAFDPPDPEPPPPKPHKFLVGDWVCSDDDSDLDVFRRCVLVLANAEYRDVPSDAFEVLD